MILRRSVLVVVLAFLVGLMVAGCGDKIAVPQPEGLFSVDKYLPDGDPLDVPDGRQVLSLQGTVLLLESGSLVQMTQSFEEIRRVPGFADARAACVDPRTGLVFVWDQGTQTMSWYQTSDLTPPPGVPGSTGLPEVLSGAGMATSAAGIELAAGGETFLYLADPELGVVHRFVYDPFTGLLPFGILCNDEGSGTRAAKSPAGLARDAADMMLVCDVAAERNWVIRFDAVPDLADTTSTGQALWRGLPALFGEATDEPPPPADYVLGDAPGAAADGEVFDQPLSVAVDGSGRIFVADRDNHRVQVFSATGVYDFAHGDSAATPRPESLAVIDEGSDPEIDYAAYLLILSDGVLRRFISGEHYDALNEDPGPLD